LQFGIIGVDVCVTESPIEIDECGRITGSKWALVAPLLP
jgi:hypothetical protein